MPKLLHRFAALPLLRRLVRDQRGQALTEFALVAPLLFIVLFGMIDFGRAFNYWLSFNHLASVGARAAAVNNLATCPDGTTPTSLQAYVRCYSGDRALANSAQICLSFPTGSGVTNPATVSVSRSYTWLPLIGSIVGSPTVAITGSATMQLETSSTLTAGCS